ncbi:MAG: trimethyllysine dioxygenase [Ilumatobacteraceae bacterium]
MIVSTHASPDRLTVHWNDGATTEYPWLWLRDHAHDPATIHPDTQQRQLHTAGVDPTLRASSFEVTADDVAITWVGGGTSTLPVRFLHAHRSPRPASAGLASTSSDVVPWDAESIRATWPTIGFEQVIDPDEGDDGVSEWLDLVARFGFAFVTGTPPTPDATERLLRRVGYVRETIFGGMWDFQADLSKADTAYTNLELLPHTDGTYSHDAPGLQLLHCLAFDGTGGESTMVDGYRIASELRATRPDAYDVLSTVAVPGQYIGDGSHLMAARPVLRHDAAGSLVQVSFNNADRAPFLLAHDEMVAFYDALRAFESLANDHRLQWRRVNPPGDALLFDNWRVLHGRAAYTGHRHLCGGYVNREDYESRRRVVAVR